MIYIVCLVVVVIGGLMVHHAWRRSYQENTVALAIIGGILIAISVWFIGTSVAEDIRRDDCMRLSSEINKPTRYDSYEGCKVRYKKMWIPAKEFDRMETR